MLHEILLSLSGHPSSLLASATRDSKGHLAGDPFPLLLPPEAALLRSIAHLATLHRDLRDHASRISASHPSTICRATATSITSTQLARFQQKILDVESQILRKDASSVGAYNIVPLAGVVGEFEEWTRRMEWLMDIACFMLPLPSNDGHRQDTAQMPGSCSGAAIVDKLRQESQTGYPDIEDIALQLGKAAETAWLRQLSTWTLYGKLPAFGSQDFFVQKREEAGGVSESFYADSKLLPKFVLPQTASSILFIGKSLNHIKNSGHATKDYGPMSSTTSSLALVPMHLRHLSDLSFPLSSAQLARAISEIRQSVSRNSLQQLLPLEKILQLLSLLQEFFLLGRGEFAVTLIQEADEHVRSRYERTTHVAQSNVAAGLSRVVVKEGEVTATLARTWAALSTFMDENDAADESLDLARDLIHLSVSKPSTTRLATHERSKEGVDGTPRLADVAFNDVLFSTPTKLTLDVSSPLDLFMTASDLEMYTTINSYLLAIRRAHLHLAHLWRQTSLRRDHPAPLGPPYSSAQSGKEKLHRMRERARSRRLEMRKVWATCGAAVFLLSETAGYLEGEVVQESWKHFHTWIVGPRRSSEVNRPEASMLSDEEADEGIWASTRDPSIRKRLPKPGELRTPSERASHDLEVLAAAHRRFLAALSHAVLLTDLPYTKALRIFIAHTDQLVAYITRLQTVQQNRDLEEDDGVVDALADYSKEEKDITLELDRSRKRVDSGMRDLVKRLRELDVERIGAERFVDGAAGEEGAYVPWRVGGVERLLMKLDFGRLADGEEGFDDR
ncbi:hypothetical protein B0A49_01701 [Cryomyces minteri]|uniref:Spindle pole body component n=1 Tax=Cryomyces minteri TaxID=331657 RepID=A0A4U0XPJ2_9PEZI|nr:hypothetical protein B0A49_01701 [Cryomyces minteri]